MLHLRLGFPTLPWWGAPALKSDHSLVMADASSEEAVQQYSSLLEQISSSPYQRDLHLERVRLAKQLSLSDEVEQGRQAYAQILALSEGAFRQELTEPSRCRADRPGYPAEEWLEWNEDRKKSLPQLPADDVTPYLDVIELYRRGSREYLCAFCSVMRAGPGETKLTLLLVLSDSVPGQLVKMGRLAILPRSRPGTADGNDRSWRRRGRRGYAAGGPESGRAGPTPRSRLLHRGSP